MLSVWARQMKILYGAIFWIFVALLLVLFAIPFFKTTPTCSDGIQNQGETAPDKGGPCKALDERFLYPLSVRFVRVFPVKSDTYMALAYLDNPNKEAGIKKLFYKFNLYAEDGLLVAEKEGSTFILPETIIPIVESFQGLSKFKPVYATFSVTREPFWEKMKNQTKGIEVNIKSVTTDKKPRIDAEVTNLTINDFYKLHFIAIVYDKKGNAFAVSKTYLDRLKPGETKSFAFVWPNQFREDIGKIEIHSLIEP